MRHSFPLTQLAGINGRTCHQPVKYNRANGRYVVPPLSRRLRSLHILIGTLLAIALAYRAFWRRTSGIRFPPDALSVWDRTASLVHIALYLLSASVLMLGMFNAWVRGDDIFGLFHLPKYGNFTLEARHAFAERVVGFRALGANALLILSAGHAAAGLFHYAVARDGGLQRMVPWLGLPQA